MLLNYSFEFIVVDVGESYVKVFEGVGYEGREEVVEEDCVEDGVDEGDDGVGVGEEVEDEFGGGLGVYDWIVGVGGCVREDGF